MAKPIRATPTLNSNEAKLFIEKMIQFEKSKINKVDLQIAKRIKENEKYFIAC